MENSSITPPPFLWHVNHQDDAPQQYGTTHTVTSERTYVTFSDTPSIAVTNPSRSDNPTQLDANTPGSTRSYWQYLCCCCTNSPKATPQQDGYSPI